jgi:uncharacterized protein YjeT (DUF2065 family)
MREKELSENQRKPMRPYQYHEGALSAVSVGAVFILIGLTFVITPGLWEKIVAFLSDFTIRQVPGMGISLPAPAAPAAHAELYAAVFKFSVGLVILEILLVVLRLIMHSPTRRLAQEVGNLVFWLGTVYLISTFLNDATTLSIWFGYWAGILVVLGLSLIARAMVLLAKR